LSGYGQPLLLDNSAWARAIDGRLTGPPRKRFDEALAAGELWSCPPTLLEMLYSARDDGQFTIVKSELGALRHALLSANAAEQALTAQAQLAAVPGVSHRVAPVDLLIAAIASTTELGVLHYDHDYDTIARHTALTFASVWVAPRGSID
jgi:predicted nucleic acid-binding protein